jgi:aspartyl aminopeptidase
MTSSCAILVWTLLFLPCWTVVSALASPSLPPIIPTLQDSLPLAKQAVEYFDQGTDPFHAVQASKELLEKAGFVESSVTTELQPGGKYYYTKHQSTLVAFCVGPQYQAGTATPFTIVGGHTDSPNLRVKPRSKRTAADCRLIGVECYGGGLWHTWFDRDLGVSGRVWVRQRDSDGEKSDRIASHRVQIRKPVLRISNLAIHLQTAKEREAFAINKEDHLSPILATQAQQALSLPTPLANSTTKDGWQEYQEPALLHLLAKELDCEIDDLVDFELSLFDVQTASIGGAFDEFLYSARLDNLASCFMAVQGLANFVQSDAFTKSSAVSMICLYDHEEVGSSSTVGAASPVLSEAVPRILTGLNGGTTVESHVVASTLAQSLVLSADQAHAVHPNYASKHEKAHQPHMNQGMVIKRNTNQRYATTPWTGVVMREIARKAQLPPLQEFIVRQDCGCGSTIGPIISSRTGISAIDMGCPQLSMHSIREIMGVTDLTHGLRLFEAFFEHYPAVKESVEN